MPSIRMLADKSGITLVSGLALSLCIQSTSAMESQVPQTGPEPQSEPIEQIEITGRATRLQLKAEIEHAEIEMFGLFNELNDIREFDVKCQAVMITGSRISERECVPIYMKRVRMDAAQRLLFTDLTPPIGEGTNRAGLGISIDTKGSPESEAQIWFQNNPRHREFNVKFRELAAQHPELATAALELQAKRDRLKELEERQRNDGAAGKLFGSGSKDAE